jgi:hypothetical protein
VLGSDVVVAGAVAEVFVRAGAFVGTGAVALLLLLHPRQSSATAAPHQRADRPVTRS